MQLEIEGIGQQKATLADWKKDNEIYSHKAWAVLAGDCPWSAWANNPDPIDHLGNHGDHWFGHGETEKEAILKLCEIEEIKIPFWWK